MMMEIGERLRELRQAKGLSQGDIEERTGLVRCFLSRLECGHGIPSLGTLEKIAEALDLELYQIFYSGEPKRLARQASRQGSLKTQERDLLEVFRRLSPPDKKLLLGLARFSARKPKRKT